MQNAERLVKATQRHPKGVDFGRATEAPPSACLVLTALTWRRCKLMWIFPVMRRDARYQAELVVSGNVASFTLRALGLTLIHDGV